MGWLRDLYRFEAGSQVLVQVQDAHILRYRCLLPQLCSRENSALDLNSSGLELEAYQKQHPSSEEPQNLPSGIDIVSGTPRPAQVPTAELSSSRPELIQFTTRDKMTGLPTGCTYPRRERQLPDRLSF